MAQKKVAKKSNTGKVALVAVGVAALSAAAYLLMGPDAKKNRKNLKAWMVKMKADVAEKIEGMAEVTADKYQSIVEEVGNKYSKLKNIDPEALQNELVHLKKEWKNIVNVGGKKVSKVKNTAKKAIRKAVK